MAHPLNGNRPGGIGIREADRAFERPVGSEHEVGAVSTVDKHDPAAGPGHHVSNLAKLARAAAHAPELGRQLTGPVDDHDPGGGAGLVPNVETAARVEVHVLDFRKRIPPLGRNPADPVHLHEIGRERIVLARRWSGWPAGIAAAGGQQRNDYSATGFHEVSLQGWWNPKVWAVRRLRQRGLELVGLDARAGWS